MLQVLLVSIIPGQSPDVFPKGLKRVEHRSPR
jgi:hypothetical protein